MLRCRVLFDAFQFNAPPGAISVRRQWPLVGEPTADSSGERLMSSLKRFLNVAIHPALWQEISMGTVTRQQPLGG